MYQECIRRGVFLNADTLLIHTPHPGGASYPRADTRINAYQRVYQRVAAFMVYALIRADTR